MNIRQLRPVECVSVVRATPINTIAFACIVRLAPFLWLYAVTPAVRVPVAEVGSTTWEGSQTQGAWGGGRGIALGPTLTEHHLDHRLQMSSK